MNLITRGLRNAFRNVVRSLSIVIILGLSLGLSLTMLVANKAVGNKIADVKSAIGNTITISPAGFNPGSQANNALTTSELSKVKALAHVTAVSETLTDRLSTTGSTSSFGRFGRDSSGSTTSLKSPVTIKFNGGGHFFVSGGNGSSTAPTNFSPPISFLGTNDPHVLNSQTGNTVTLKSGAFIDGSKDTNNAMISTDMASKNNLKVGSTFTAYNKTLTVAGIFNSNSDQGVSDIVVLSLPALQRLSGQANVVTAAVATVDSIDNLSATTTAVQNALGSGTADVTSAQQQADNTVKPLNSVKTVSLFSLIGSVVAGAVIILLVMIMVVRERKREIGVLKAIGGSNVRIMAEFMVEALTLTIAGAVIGLVIGVTAGQPVTKMLVNNSTASTTTQFGGRPFDPGAATSHRNPGGFGGRFRNNAAVQGLSNIKAQVGWGIVLDGFGAAVLIAVVGSALASGMIAKVRPSEVLRSE